MDEGQSGQLCSHQSQHRSAVELSSFCILVTTSGQVTNITACLIAPISSLEAEAELWRGVAMGAIGV